VCNRKSARLKDMERNRQFRVGSPMCCEGHRHLRYYLTFTATIPSSHALAWKFCVSEPHIVNVMLLTAGGGVSCKDD